ncbi:MAG: hypothetical protein RL637_357 [Pseudomonadota bacterium]|jgi:predicted RNA-binding protein (virulence factor B family)
MLAIGKLNLLTISRCVGDIYLTIADDPEIEIRLPAIEAPATYAIGDQLPVFVYQDSHNQLVATLQKPFAQVDEIAYLKVVDLSSQGAFLEWGLAKDLFVPLSEQRQKLKIGRWYFVKLFLDQQQRIAATAKFERFIISQAFYFEIGEKVTAIITEKTDLGFKAIINHQYWGMFYNEDVFNSLKIGQTITAYIKNIRPDYKIDLSLHPLGYVKIDGMSAMILEYLHHHQGQLALGDKSSPETIYATLGISKKAFKQAIGALFKQKFIQLSDHSIQLLKK